MALYDFTDTQEVPKLRGLPSEALMINGIFIENLIEGYTTISTVGRELIKKEISSEVIGSTDGAFFDYSRIPDRIITVRFKLEASNSEDFRNKFNKLNEVLNVEQAKLIFNDELDKYFVGTLQDIENVQDGRNVVSGSFTMYCADPYKYAVEKTVIQVPSGEDSVVLSNDGNGDAFVNIKATMKDDNGYIGYVLGDRVYQQGVVNEPDTVPRTKSETLLNAKQFTGGNTTVSGVVPVTGNSVILPSSLGKSGTLAVGSYKDAATGNKTVRALTLPNSPANVTGKSYNGGAVMWTIPADSSGVSGALNWRMNFKMWFETALIKETANVFIGLVGENGQDVASINIDKYSNNNNHAFIRIRCNGSLIQTVNFDPNFWSDISNFKTGAMSIQKKGSLFTFKYPVSRSKVSGMSANSTGTITFRSDALAKVKVTRISAWIGRANNGFKQLVTRRYLRDFNFIKDNVEYTEDIPNFFSEGDVWELDSENNVSRINDLDTGVMRDIASRPLVLPSGNYELALGISDYATVPDWEVSYRKRWL